MPNLTNRPEKRRVLIMGASGGLGQALCHSFFQDNSFLGIHAHSNLSKGEALLRSLTGVGKDAALLVCDLKESGSVRKMFDDLLIKWGRIDVLINTAGIIDDRLFARIGEVEWDRVVQTNLTGAFYCMREAGRIMHQQEGGHIINLLSLSAFTGRAGQAAYAASKRGLAALTMSAAREWGPRAIQVNAVLPGLLDTGMTGSLTFDQKEKLIQENVLGRASTLEEVSEFIVHLSKMKYVSGQVFNLDSRIY